MCQHRASSDSVFLTTVQQRRWCWRCVEMHQRLCRIASLCWLWVLHIDHCGAKRKSCQRLTWQHTVRKKDSPPAHPGLCSLHLGILVPTWREEDTIKPGTLQMCLINWQLQIRQVKAGLFRNMTVVSLNSKIKRWKGRVIHCFLRVHSILKMFIIECSP